MSPRRADAPPALPGFERVARYFDLRTRRWTAQLMPGESYVTASDELIQTVLGSCVSVCARDPVTGLGGMNHYMLPGRGPGLRFGEAALEHLVETLHAHGAALGQLEFKLFGGGRVIGRPGTLTDIGQLNVAFIKEAFLRRGFVATAESLGGTFARSVRYSPATGRATVHSMNMTEAPAAPG